MSDFLTEYSNMLIAGITMGGIGLLIGILIGIAAKIFKVASDDRIEAVASLLPGANCGGCGKAGCADFAKAVVSGELSPNQCAVISQDNIDSIAEILNIKAGSTIRKCAVVLCGGDKYQTVNPILYNGINDCRSANMISGGPKGCNYGCLGLGSCAKACPFGAIEIVNGLAVVHKNLCTGCGKCAAECPRKLIKIVNADCSVHVYCSNPEKAVIKRQYCHVPCLGCRKCEKTFPGKFTVNGFIAAVNYDSNEFPDNADIQTIKCPSKCLLTDREHLALEHSDPSNNDIKEECNV